MKKQITLFIVLLFTLIPISCLSQEYTISSKQLKAVNIMISEYSYRGHVISVLEEQNRLSDKQLKLLNLKLANVQTISDNRLKQINSQTVYIGSLETTLKAEQREKKVVELKYRATKIRSSILGFAGLAFLTLYILK